MTEQRERDQTLIFLHIQKTGGTTLHRIIERHYPPEEIYFFDAWQFTFEHFTGLSEEERAGFRMLRGHMVFGMHEYLQRPSTYFTVLRDPVERVISYYYHIRRDPNHHWHGFVTSNDLDLKAFLKSGKDLGMTDFQTRVLAGGRWHDSPYGECPQEALEVAKQHLHERFAVVGLLGRFDDTLLLLKDAFGWQDLFYVRRNVTRKRPRKYDLSPDTLAAILEANSLDVQLYEYASEMFDEEVHKRGSGFISRVRLFQTVNRFLGPLLYGTPQTGAVQRFAAKRARRWFVGS